jgi:hypothetical protein
VTDLNYSIWISRPEIGRGKRLTDLGLWRSPAARCDSEVKDGELLGSPKEKECVDEDQRGVGIPRA